MGLITAGVTKTIDKLKSIFGAPTSNQFLFNNTPIAEIIQVNGQQKLKLIATFSPSGTPYSQVKGMLNDAHYVTADALGADKIDDIVIGIDANGKAICIRGACFVAETPVHTSSGLSPIESIKQGDIVKSFDEAEQKTTFQKVVRTFKKTTDKLIRVIAGKDTIFATPEHPFYTFDNIPDGSKEGQWTSAINLKKGLKVLLVSGLLANVESTFAFDTTATVYNFEVENTHTYYVGTEGVLVHNDCASLQKLLTESGFTNLLNKFNSIQDDALRARFVADFEQYPTTLVEFNKDIDLFEAWKAIPAKAPERLELVTLRKAKIVLGSDKLKLANGDLATILKNANYNDITKRILSSESKGIDAMLDYLTQVHRINPNNMGLVLSGLKTDFPPFMYGNAFRLRVCQEMGWNNISNLEETLRDAAGAVNRYADISTEVEIIEGGRVVMGTKVYETKYYGVFSKIAKDRVVKVNKYLVQLGKDLENAAKSNLLERIDFEHFFSKTATMTSEAVLKQEFKTILTNAEYNNADVLDKIRKMYGGYTVSPDKAIEDFLSARIKFKDYY